MGTRSVAVGAGALGGSDNPRQEHGEHATHRERGYYCAVQYCPDATRSESANVGALLFVPSRGFLQARIQPLSLRVRSFFDLDETQTARANMAAASLEHLVNSGLAQIDSIGSLEHFCATRAGDIKLTRPRLVMVGEPESEMRALSEELAG